MQLDCVNVMLWNALLSPYLTPGTLMTSAAADVINHNQTYTILLCKDEPMSSVLWADVILADFQKVIPRYLQHISTYISCTA